MKTINLMFLLLVITFSNITLAAEKLKTNNTKNMASHMHNKPKLLFLAGSARKDSVNKMLAHNAFEIAKAAGADVTFINLKDYPLPIYDGDLESKQGLPKKAIALKKIFADHDAIFIASPEYNSSISPLLKNTLDWVSRSNEENEPANRVYNNKVVALGSASPGGLGGGRGLVPLQMMLSNIGVIILPKKISISKAYDKFNKEGLLINVENYQELTAVVMDFIRITTAIKNSL
ncbi:NAD(P)H-dependent FMN reductase [Candidatus Trichorickettsia mobilis]|uniref:NAD(P)H-dependent FMN reductase n=1 Tax=Candidatus Trichorickettsia mobilis TaxID=1346319 RepID=A0ABZ0UU13_9RICK|nr:NAD(P)H-dependent oxidoreductase [Candidatus Trichorickettsia mobilis]WPY00582.1 NAD(P)H-dependent FMN reductase [Candidatus Trichorickettsia mobilis]